MAIGRADLRITVFLAVLGLLAAVGCQAQKDDLPAAEPAAVELVTATDAPVHDEAEAESTPTASLATMAAVDGNAQAEPTEAATEEFEIDRKETPTPAPEDSGAGAGADADVEFVRAVQGADGVWTFHVTVRHPDTGWEDYADGWDVVTPDGEVLKTSASDPFTRLLVHPHENEQPFTRSQSGIVVPDGVTIVIVRAHDLVDGYGGREIGVDLSTDSGPGYEVERQ